MKNLQLKTLLRQPKTIAAAALLVSVCLFMLGLEWPLLLVAAASIAILLPMPRVFDSWFSRVFMSIFFIYALLQVAAIVQLYVYPAGKFAFMGLLVAVFTAVLIGIFGRSARQRNIRIFRVKDLVALLACVLFIVPFSPILRGNDSSQRIGEIAAVQVVDAITHQSVVVGYTDTQTLRGDYKIGRYYPTGFHIATAFMEHTAFGNVNDMSWASRVMLYFMQYIVLGVLLCMMLVYLSFVLLSRLRQKAEELDIVSIATIGLAVGAATTIMHLWLFVDGGFLNYFYVCAAAIAATCYIIDAKIQYDERADVAQNRQRYVWPLFAYLLLSFGASCSWPLLAPVFLLTALMIMLPINRHILKKHLVPYIWVCVPIVIIALLHVATVYMQSIYEGGSTSNSSIILMAGFLGNFNITFLLIGFAVIGFMVMRRATDGLGNAIVAVVAPLMFLVCGLMALHYFKLGEVHYYVIKVAMILEMLFLAFGIPYLVDALKRTDLNGIMRFVWSFGIVLVVVFASIGTTPHPFIEVRSLFRKQSGAGIPPFVDHDVRTVSHLQSANKLQNFNMTILHYDPAGDRFFAHIQIAAWAQTVSKYGIDTEQTSGSIDVFTDRNQSCFAKQFSILTWPVFTAESKRNLEQIVRTCAQTAAKHGQRYYVVTDKQSAPVIKETFGSSVEVVY